MKTFLGHWLTSEDRWHGFSLVAENYEHAERLAADLSPRARIYGQRIDEVSDEIPDVIDRLFPVMVSVARQSEEAASDYLEQFCVYLGTMIAFSAHGDARTMERLLVGAEAHVSGAAARYAPMATRIEGEA